MTELSYLTASELAPLIKNKQLSPVELTESLLNRIEQVNQSVNAYITIIPEIALEEARHAENQIMNGFYKGPLHGIPIGHKDNFNTKGIRTTSGSKLLYDYIPKEDATVVEKLSCSGAIMLGKLNLHEFGGGQTNTNQYYGHARNPWNLSYTPGGSSGGSSAALAAGLTPIATGTDTFGSIRLPSAWAGVYGIKPTYGLVSGYGLLNLARSMDHGGPMARSVKDLALMLNVMAGYDSKDPASIKAPIPDYCENLNKGIKGVKIGVPSYFLKGLDADVERLFKQAIYKLEGLGANVKEIDIPELEMAAYAGYVTVTGEAANLYQEMLQESAKDFNLDVRIFMETGFLTNSNEYIRAQQVRREMTEAFKKAYEDVDILIGPTAPLTAYPYQSNWVQQNLEVMQRLIPFTSPTTLTGTPNLSVPIGLSSEGLPSGMQIMGNHLNEKLIFQVGSAWESTNPLGGQLPMLR
ncbi:amidase [Alkalibacillus silvisoli]|uniref:Asp-tRNA(Asn)/Glu-tRNA(Gln) amidotransferase subunit GatA n=1 Tax=Alkalibacillus silvisoli TaxID=392823 RepID=A0ABP3K5F4_9BACI